MNADKAFSVHVLKEGKAWNLFKKIVGDRVNADSVQSTTIDACRSCRTFQGLPLAIICSFMPYNATIFDLLKYGRAFGLLRGIKSTEDARQKLHRLIQHLKSSCLSFDGRTPEEFGLNDVIRNVAASIESKRGGILLLKAFQLYNKNPALRISDQFFSKMKELKVLDVKGMQHLSVLPSSLGLLQDLQTLCLESCLLRQIEMVEKMKKLEILSFYDSFIEELPEEIRQLKQLKVLNLDYCSQLSVIPPNLSQPEEQLIGNSFAQWEDGQGAGRHASLRELKQLSDLTSLNLHVLDYRNMPKRVFSEKLQRYKILIGNMWDWSDKHEASRTSRSATTSRSSSGGLQNMVEIITEGRGSDVDENEATTIVEFEQLRSLKLQQLLRLTSFNASSTTVALSNERRSATTSRSSSGGLQNMVEIITEGRGSDVDENEATTIVEFEQLRSLKLQQLLRLTSFNASSTTVALSNERRITDMAGAAIFSAYLSSKFNQHHSGGLWLLDELTLDSRDMSMLSRKTCHLTFLATIKFCKCIVTMNQLFSIMFIQSFTNLDKIYVGCCRFRELFPSERLIGNPKKPLGTLSRVRTLKLLVTLAVLNCHGVEHIISSSTAKTLVQLTKMSVRECLKVTEIVANDEEAVETLGEIIFRKLVVLELNELPSLLYFCSGNYALRLPYLEEINAYSEDNAYRTERLPRNAITNNIASYWINAVHGLQDRQLTEYDRGWENITTWTVKQ
ncbi:uncharacterized protein LOC120162368 [Hibiscus syriacus]|uniref:uncharacterized protein LOC120162368 n=1 Tax=Hibiscus syriacus TaxID=106335 RepID=UPI001924DF0F|nr:uncharacterized protein LOC120162368 [Hibiscus syriacus]